MTDIPMTPTDHLLIHEHAETAYLQYAMTTVKDRALAQVQDGQKPVQRRILFALHQLGLRADVKPVKSARIVGDVLGKYHPHGDTAAYDAMVRMAQPFMLRYPLVDGQGNFGSPDGDSAAAMRYTEARLAPFAQLLLAEVDQDTVDFRPNYDGAFQEPVLLPARLPILLANGTLGVAVGMASSVPSHNLRELATAAALVVANPAARLDEVLALMPAPDFPGGGQLISSAADMRETYESGRGSFRVRARWSIEELARGQYQIVVTELPYQVSARQVLEQIEVLSNPQPAAGKKAATPAQLTLRAALLELLEKAVDESSQSSPVRLVLVPRTSKVDATLLMDFLFANTALEAGFSLNLTFIGANGRPQQRGLMDVLTQWADFRMETVRRRTAHELAKNEARSHILAGRLIAFDAIEAVVRVIREADDPATELKAKFGLSDIQAADILEMRLRALNRLEGVKLTEELDALKTRAKALRLLLADESALRALVVAEIEADGKTFGDERRTLVEEAEAVTLKAGRKAAAMTLADEPVTVTLSKNLLIKTRNGHVTDPSSLAWRAGDGPLAIVAARSTWPLIVLDDTGRAYTVSISDLPGGRGDGVPLTSLIELTPGARIVTAFSGEPDSRWLLAGARGYGFVIPLAKAMATRRAGKALLTVQPKEPVLPPIALKASDTAIAVLSSSDRVLVFGANELKTLPNGGQGTQLMALNDDERVIMLVAGNEAGFAVKAKGKELKLVGEALERYAGKRARRGGKLPGPGSALRALGNADA